MTRHPDSPWTPDRIQELKELWGRGLSASHIGRIMGLTRNTIIGKAHRLGLSARGRAHRPTVTIPMPEPKPVVKEAPQGPPEPSVDDYLAPGEIAPAGHCKWIEGDTGPGKTDWRYCGQPTGENGAPDRNVTRCAFHTRQMYARPGRIWTSEEQADHARSAASRRKYTGMGS